MTLILLRFHFYGYGSLPHRQLRKSSLIQSREIKNPDLREHIQRVDITFYEKSII